MAVAAKAGASRAARRSSAFNGARVAAAPVRRARRCVDTTCRAGVAVFRTEEAQAARAKKEYIDPRTVAAVILGGGKGSRLYPLTAQRAKPAVPIGGAYRLIDVPMSNCLNSGINKMYILTQYNSTSLNRHLARTYNFGNGIISGGNATVEVLAATQTPTDKEWFRGTADAVRQYSWLFSDVKNNEVEDIVILSGDHLYRMDYMDFVAFHRKNDAAITIGVLPMDESRASDFGLMSVDENKQVTKFAEKPTGEALKEMQTDYSSMGFSPAQVAANPYLASMGIYVFNKRALTELLGDEYPDMEDFGGEIIPAAAKKMKVVAYPFDGYWEDIGTIQSFFNANLALTKDDPPFEFYDAQNPIYTSPRFLPPAQVFGAEVEESILSHGCYVTDCTVRDAIVGLRSRVEAGALVEHAMVMGADFYESEEERAALRAAGEVPVGIGKNSVIRNAIVDKNGRVGENCQIINANGVEESDRCAEEGYYIRSGIVTTMRNYTFVDGTII